MNGKDLIKTTFKLAERGKGLVSPNPMVGAVIAKGGRIVGQGYHKAFGKPHAEIEALKDAGEKAKGATLLVNLEPCCHFGKTPPCTKAIIKAGIKEVLCPMKDPNPLVNGKGFEELENNGIKVRRVTMEEEAEKLNASYVTNVTLKRPYVILKWAQTIDGKTATHTGSSKWISGELSRTYVKQLRFESDAVIIGVKTLLQDNPSLDYTAPASYPKSLSAGKNYRKIILDPQLKTPFEANIWENTETPVLVIASHKAKRGKGAILKKRANCRIIEVKTRNGRFLFPELLSALNDEKIGIVFVEGGSKTLTGFWEARIADEIVVFTGNKIMGGEKGLSSIQGREKNIISESTTIKITELRKFGQDIMIKGKPCFQE